MQKFIHAQNLTRYIDLLESETDPAKLDRIQKLLIEEEDRYGSVAERLDQADDFIRQGQGRLREQQALVARLQSDGRDTGRAVSLLETMHRTLQLMAEYRRTLSDGLDQTSL